MFVNSLFARCRSLKDIFRSKTLVSLFFTAFMLVPGIYSFGQIYEVGIMTGSSFYIGDLRPYMAPGDLFQDNRFAGGALLRYNHNQHISFRMNMLWANIYGHEENSNHNIQGGTYSFDTRIIELSLQGEVNFLPFTPGDEETRFTPFIFGGTGGFQYFLKPAGGHNDLKAINQNFIIGAGFKLNISANFTTGIEWGMRGTWTDNLDYSDTISTQGNPKSNDWYSFAGISISYKFLDRSRPPCPIHNN